jgi:hypothetical protein
MGSWLLPRAGRFTPTSSYRCSLAPGPRNCALSPGRTSISMRSHPSSWCGVRCALEATPRPGSHAARWSYRSAAPTRSVSHRGRQDQLRKRAGDRWHDNDLVFASRVGTALYAGNVRRSFRAVLTAAGLNSADWTPRELRHSFVSLLSDAGVPIEKIARCRPHRDDHNRDRLPQADPSRGHWWHLSHGRPVSQAGRRCLVTQRRRAMTPDGLSWPLIWWAVQDLNL